LFVLVVKIPSRIPKRGGFIFIREGIEMYKKVETSLNFVEREKEIIAYWKENGIF